MKHARVTDETIAEIQKAAPWARRRDIGPPPGHEDEIGVASTVIDNDMVWAPFELEPGDLALLAEGEPVWFAQVGLPIRPFSGAIDPWGIRRFGLRSVDKPTLDAEAENVVLRELLHEAAEFVYCAGALHAQHTDKECNALAIGRRVADVLGLEPEEDE